MKRIKTAIITGLISAFLIAPSFLVSPSLAEKALERKIDYEIRCGGFHIGNGSYSVLERNGNYEVKLHGWCTPFFKFLGLEYKFSSEGHQKEKQLYPSHFKRENREGDSGNGEIPKKVEVTDISFDYEKLKAKSYAYKEIWGKREVKHDTRNAPKEITKETKDFLTLIEEIKREELRDSYELKTVAKGEMYSLKIRKIGEETLNINDKTYETVVYQLQLKEDLLGVDSSAKMWLDKKDKNHTLLKGWVKEGPLWTSITIQYTGKSKFQSIDSFEFFSSYY